MKALRLHHYSGREAEERYNLAAPRNLFFQRIPTVDSGDPVAKMEEIRNYVHNTMEMFERVFDSLPYEESFLMPPIHKLRHPMIFYYGHTACFYINKLCVAGLTERINPTLENMCAIGVDEMSWDDLNEAHYSWPSVEEVCEYRRQVRDRIDHLMSSGKFPLEMPLTLANSTKSDANLFWWVMLMCAEHERIHFETVSVHVRELPMKYVTTAMSDVWRRCSDTSTQAPINDLVPIAGGKVQVGRTPDSRLYGWDCDYANGHNIVEVAPFKASKYIVSNAEFFSFMKAGGYRVQRYWDEEGWKWVQWKKPEHPWFWVRDEARSSGFALRLQTELIDLPWNWPCELNNLEAHAFCSFKSEQLGKKVRMLTEAEWTLLFDRYIGKDQPEWGERAPGNISLEHYQSSCPVDKFQHGDLYDVIGNVWQHCECFVYPYPGYRVHPLYDDFSLPTFDGRHTCMKGGTWASSGNMATRDARFAFRRHFFQYIGLRYVEGPEVQELQGKCTGFGLDPEVDIITDTCFRDSFQGLPNGCVAIADHAKRMFAEHATVPAVRAMDIACGGGRVTFELTTAFQQVIGVDYTARRLVPAFAIRERGDCQYSVENSTNGERTARYVNSNNFPWGPTRERATFFQADPTNLHTHLSDFSLVVCWNCLERSYHPSAIPAHLLGRVVKGGLLVIGGDYQWDNIKKDTEDTGTQDKRYLTDCLVTSKGNLQEEIFRLLGGSDAVEQVGEVASIPVAFPTAEGTADIRVMKLATYRKK
ncbi:5-histidylcysteine sulfoxide synthase, putative [Leishmania panamensis]|uniref:5-histidylcysteine sulfoxide synthase, putative n=1 Tax=Leishmania panamensis TaxID=5679 RepID=A0A088RXP3_LEIPA|nr:5-histidylcysteine sulfoxide synthase, putative [Leishmania panamensis]AIO00050.1 5-histidylcysteine sulfoxide synthase, putative [Leishmania panamensis]